MVTELRAAAPLADADLLFVADQVLAQWADGIGNGAFDGVLEDHAISVWEHGDEYELATSWMATPAELRWRLETEASGKRRRVPVMQART